ncbi:SDR family NAD(P)-dependent oxidoreductase [Plantactinospora sp. CA-294935]|uniref:SDR family NAD(P)-dependent oxidoreductase n=1 Tax=Plantactinospora sp. CA-294935 TaxID=3240012 RepID=UPI003D8A5E4D
MSESFEGRKVVVVGGSSGMGLATAHQVGAGGGTAVITGRDQDKVGAAVEASSQNGKAWGITAELTDRDQAPEVRSSSPPSTPTRSCSSTPRVSSSRRRSASTMKPSTTRTTN